MRYTFLVFICFFSLYGNGLQAQQTQLLYLQSEGEQPFTAEIGGVQYSSSLNGYLSLPALPRGEYTLQVGFGSAQYVFPCVLGAAPRGFFIKREVDNVSTLFDMVSFEETRGVMASAWKEQQLAKQKEAEKAAKETARKTGVSAGIRKIYDRASPDGVDQVYVVSNGDKKDTIALFIPVLDEIKPRGSGQLMNPRLPEPLRESAITTMMLPAGRNRYTLR